MQNRIDEIMELANGEKYFVLKQAIYKGENYYVVSRVSEDEDDLTDDIKFLHELIHNGNASVEVVKDMELTKLLAKHLGFFVT